MAVDLTKNQEELSKAWRQVVDQKDKHNWALFGYEGSTNIIKLMSTGDNGLTELVSELNCSLIQYAFCRIIDNQSNLNKLVLINWQGDSSPLSRKGLCASHVGDVVSYFKGCSQTITLRNDDEATPEYIMSQISKPSSVKIDLSRQSESADNYETPVISSTYKRTDIRSEIPKDRKSFWQVQEEEEKKRLAEEKKRAQERQAQFERERKLREELEAKKLAETIKERDRKIEATRQAELHESTKNKPSSSLSQPVDEAEDCVGRRSDLIRQERNQETLSLISKGSIKNKRALFEQGFQQQSPPQQSSQPSSIGSNPQRRPSGTVVSQRLEAFQSLENSNSSSSTIDKLANGLARRVSISDKESNTGVETTSVSTTFTRDSKLSDPKSGESHTSKEEMVHDDYKLSPDEKSESRNDSSRSEPGSNSSEDKVTSNGSKSNGSMNANGHGEPTSEMNNLKNNIKESTADISPKKEKDIDYLDPSIECGIRAKALYDYQAGEPGEISFDPGDIICHIKKVDPGWWHGSVATGRFKGQVGLFPFNYVGEF